MKPIIKINTGMTIEVIQWLIRLVIMGVIFFLVYKIYPVNPFFVMVFGGILLMLVLAIPEEKIVVDREVLVLTKLFCFNLIRVKKVVHLDKIKSIIVAGNINLHSRVIEFILPYLERGRASNEIRIVYSNGEVINYRTAIYMDDLLVFEIKLKELVSEKNKFNSFSQPIQIED